MAIVCALIPGYQGPLWIKNDCLLEIKQWKPICFVSTCEATGNSMPTASYEHQQELNGCCNPHGYFLELEILISWKHEKKVNFRWTIYIERMLADIQTCVMEVPCRLCWILLSVFFPQENCFCSFSNKVEIKFQPLQGGYYLSCY